MKWPKAKLSSEELKSIFEQSACVTNLFFPKQVPNPPRFEDVDTSQSQTEKTTQEEYL